MALIRGNALLLKELPIVIFFILSSTSHATLSSTFNSTSVDEIFEQWMTLHGHVYSNDDEKNHRFSIFKTNVEYIHNFNKLAKTTYQLGLNKFSDRKVEEIVGRQQVGFETLATSSALIKYENNSNIRDIPANMDWRNHGAVTPVKNQAKCVNNISDF